MTKESSMDFLARLRAKARDNKEELSCAEQVFLKVADESEEEAILGQGTGSKL